MTQRQNKILGGKKGKKNKDDDLPRKPMVFSFEDPEKMANESTKAKMNFKDPANAREFSSYFYGQKKNTDPFYIATSHEEKSPLPKKERVIPTYPAMFHGLRWGPSVESYGENYEDDQRYLCRTCTNRENQNCYAEYQEDVRSSRGAFRDNIRRFVDSSTMTPRLNDASCGARSPQSQGSYTSVSVTSDFAARDRSNIQVRYPTSRVHRTRDYESNLNYQYYERKPEVIPEINCMDDEAYSYVSSPTVRRRRLPLCRKPAVPSEDCDRSRKILYNEGISDMIATDYPDHCALGPMQGNVKPKRNYSKGSVFSRGIPYAHRSQSKYHYDCNEQDFKSYRCEVDDDVKHLVAKPKVLRYGHTKKPTKFEESFIKMPKKVLSSERDIDAYIRTRRPNFY